jgi:hypothetical protein
VAEDDFLESVVLETQFEQRRIAADVDVTIHGALDGADDAMAFDQLPGTQVARGLAIPGREHAFVGINRLQALPFWLAVRSVFLGTQFERTLARRHRQIGAPAFENVLLEHGALFRRLEVCYSFDHQRHKIPKLLNYSGYYQRGRKWDISSLGASFLAQPATTSPAARR